MAVFCQAPVMRMCGVYLAQNLIGTRKEKFKIAERWQKKITYLATNL